MFGYLIIKVHSFSVNKLIVSAVIITINMSSTNVSSFFILTPFERLL